MPILCEPASPPGELMHQHRRRGPRRGHHGRRGHAARQRSHRDPGGDRSREWTSARRWRSRGAAAGPARRGRNPGRARRRRRPADPGAAVRCPRGRPSGGPRRADGRLPPLLRGVAADAGRRHRADEADAGRPDRHRLRRQGRLRQDHAGDQPRAWRWPGGAGQRCASWTSTWRSATWRSACSSTRCGPWWTRCRWPGHLDITGAASLLTRYQPGLDMLLAPVTPGDAEKIPPAAGGRAARRAAHHVRLRRRGHARRSSASTCSPRWTSPRSSCCSPRPTCPR